MKTGSLTNAQTYVKSLMSSLHFKYQPRYFCLSCRCCRVYVSCVFNLICHIDLLLFSGTILSHHHTILLMEKSTALLPLFHSALVLEMAPYTMEFVHLG